ncbi:MAG: LAGLIDADG family homing endonuclease [Candidatus Limnocylindria bacterium]
MRTIAPRPEDDFPRRPAPAWSDEIAYVVGLIATDGCLIDDGRHIDFTTADRQLAETFLACLGRRLAVGVSHRKGPRPVYRVQVGDVRLYRWLVQIGLTPRKSLTLGAIDVPDEFLLPLVRGLLDGDGSIVNKLAPADTRDAPGYLWEWFFVTFTSASRAHLEWLRSALCRHLGVDGYLATNAPQSRRVIYALRYGKRTSAVLLRRLYADPEAPCLERKRRIWTAYVARHPTAGMRPADVARLVELSSVAQVE